METRREPRWIPYSPPKGRGDRFRDVSRRYGFFGVLVLVLGLLLGGLFLRPSFLRPSARGALPPPAAESSAAQPASANNPYEGRATLTVESRPAEAVVRLDGRSIGRTPLREHAVPAGVYVLTVEKEGHAPVDSVIALRRNRAPVVTLTLKPLGGAAPPDPEARRRRQYLRLRRQGEVSLDTANYAAARRAFSAALELFPGDGYAQDRLRLIAARLDSMRHHERYLNLMEWGRAYYRARRYEAARSAFERALEVQPGDYAAQARLAQAGQQQKAVAARRLRYEYRRGRADALYEAGAYAEAASAYEKILDSRPEDVYIRQRLEESRRRAEAGRPEPWVVHTEVDVPPEPVGGMAAIYRHIRYPPEAMRSGVEGVVSIEVVVDADSTLRTARVVRGIGGGCDDEALQALRQVHFRPAFLDGRPVTARHTLHIRFDLQY